MTVHRYVPVLRWLVEQCTMVVDVQHVPNFVYYSFAHALDQSQSDNYQGQFKLSDTYKIISYSFLRIHCHHTRRGRPFKASSNFQTLVDPHLHDGSLIQHKVNFCRVPLASPEAFHIDGTSEGLVLVGMTLRDNLTYPQLLTQSISS